MPNIFLGGEVKYIPGRNNYIKSKTVVKKKHLSQFYVGHWRSKALERPKAAAVSSPQTQPIPQTIDKAKESNPGGYRSDWKVCS